MEVIRMGWKKYFDALKKGTFVLKVGGWCKSLSRKFPQLDLGAEIIVMGVVEATNLANKRRISLQIFSNLKKPCTLNFAYGSIGYEKLIVMLIHQISFYLTAKFRMFRRWR